jgi:hypothetical protein
MLWAQIALLVLNSIGLLFAANLHGKAKTPGKHNFWVTLIATAITMALMIFAGAFDRIF